mmetsp:Transcript_12814/g.17297  ORF Transcript_12814/g.17297 Transcript_12814/m.17297 type:complete len:83 (-) Transcript_12814:82-330(-)
MRRKVPIGRSLHVNCVVVVVVCVLRKLKRYGYCNKGCSEVLFVFRKKEEEECSFVHRRREEEEKLLVFFCVFVWLRVTTGFF